MAHAQQQQLSPLQQQRLEEEEEEELPRMEDQVEMCRGFVQFSQTYLRQVRQELQEAEQELRELEKGGSGQAAQQKRHKVKILTEKVWRWQSTVENDEENLHSLKVLTGLEPSSESMVASFLERMLRAFEEW